MEALILDQNFELLTILDTFESFIWTERYYQYGDFEIYMVKDENLKQYLKKNNYISIHDSDTIMIIEHILEKSEIDTGIHVTISGRSLESILLRRVIWEKTTLTGNFQEGMKTLIEQNIINPSISRRKIDNFDFVDSEDSKIAEKEIDSYFFGENLYDAIHLSCCHRQIGIRVWVENKRFKFQMYTGVDRSYNQEDRPWVVFSPEFDNLKSSTYETDDTGYANTALIVGEDTFIYMESNTNDDGETEETSITYPQISIDLSLDESSGLDRREVFIDGSSINRESYEDGVSSIIPEEEYKDLLIAEGKKEMLDYESVEKVDGQVDATRQFIYGRDFKIGDVVQVVTDDRSEIPSRITELIRSDDADGYKLTPTFVSLASENEEEGV